MKLLKKESTIKKEVIKIAIGIVIIVINIFLYGPLMEYSHNHAKVIIHMGDVIDYSLLGKYELFVQIINFIFVLIYIISGIIIVWTILRLVVSKNNNSIKIMNVLSNFVLILSIIFTSQLLEPLISIPFDTHIERCKCGKDYVKIEER